MCLPLVPTTNQNTDLTYPVAVGISSRRHISWPCCPRGPRTWPRWGAGSPAWGGCAGASTRASRCCLQTATGSYTKIQFLFFFAIFKLEIKWRLIDLPSVYLFTDWPVRIMLLIPTLSFSPGSGLVYILLDLFPSILLARLYFIQEFFKKENWCSPQKKGTIFLNTKLIVKISFVALKEFRFKTHTHVHPYNTL